MSAAFLADYLRGFTGGETRYRHWSQRLIYTEGVKALADNGGAHWLIDAVASYQHDRRITRNEMLREIQFWTLRRHENGGATLSLHEDSGRPAVITQEIAYTDIPLAEVKLYLAGGTLMLPSEY